MVTKKLNSEETKRFNTYKMTKYCKMTFILLLISSSSFSQTLEPERDSNSRKYGYVDKNRNWIVKPIFESAYPFFNGLAIVAIGEYPKYVYGIIKKDGTYLFEPQFYDVMYNGSSAIAVGIGKERGNIKYGMVNTNADFLVQPVYLEIRRFGKGGYIFKNIKEQWVIIDNNGKTVKEYADKVDDLGNFYYYDSEPFELKEGEENDPNWYLKDNLVGLLDGNNGNILTPAIYSPEFVSGGEGEPSSPFYWNSFGLSEVKRNGKYGFIDKKGTEVIEAKYQNVGVVFYIDLYYNSKLFENPLFVKLIPVKLNGKWGYVNTQGRILIDFQYFEAEEFDNGMLLDNKKPLAKVVLNDDDLTEGYIDGKGNFSKNERDLQ